MKRKTKRPVCFVVCQLKTNFPTYFQQVQELQLKKNVCVQHVNSNVEKQPNKTLHFLYFNET